MARESGSPPPPTSITPILGNTLFGAVRAAASWPMSKEGWGGRVTGANLSIGADASVWYKSVGGEKRRGDGLNLVKHEEFSVGKYHSRDTFTAKGEMVSVTWANTCRGMAARRKAQKRHTPRRIHGALVGCR